MKRIFSLLLAMVTVLSLCLPVFAEEGDEYEYQFNNVSVLFSIETPFSSEEREQIAMELAGGIPANGFDIRCLFGHNYQADIVTVITHKVHPLNPRCLSETFEVKKCTRCGNTESTLIGSSYICCCPED